MSDDFSAETATTITRLLVRSKQGGDAAFSQAVERLYPELRRLAGFHSRQGQPVSIAATDILHEAFLKLAAHNGGYDNKDHFMAVASRAMRQIIIDYARRKSANKRGGQLKRVELDETELGIADQAGELLLINELLDRLQVENARAARVFECRFFGGMNEAEASAALDLPLRTTQRDWMKAKAFIAHTWESGED